MSKPFRIAAVILILLLTFVATTLSVLLLGYGDSMVLCANLFMGAILGLIIPHDFATREDN